MAAALAPTWLTNWLRLALTRPWSIVTRRLRPPWLPTSGAMGGRAIGVIADVSSEEDLTAASAQVLRELGACNVPVNNAALVVQRVDS